MDQFQQNLDASLETLVTHDIELTLTYLMMMIIAITTTSMVMMMLMMIKKKKKNGRRRRRRGEKSLYIPRPMSLFLCPSRSRDFYRRQRCLARAESRSDVIAPRDQSRHS